MGVHFRGSPGKVYGLNLGMPAQDRKNRIHGFQSHNLGSVRSSIHMAMVARLIAHFPNVDLKGLNTLRSEGR